MTLTLYRRDGCELCDEAEAMLRALDLAAWERIQVGWFGPLAATYGLRVPVVRRGDGEELDWPFDRERLTVFLSR
jgi:hypothetical protein